MSPISSPLQWLPIWLQEKCQVFTMALRSLVPWPLLFSLTPFPTAYPPWLCSTTSLTEHTRRALTPGLLYVLHLYLGHPFHRYPQSSLPHLVPVSAQMSLSPWTFCWRSYLKLHSYVLIFSLALVTIWHTMYVIFVVFIFLSPLIRQCIPWWEGFLSILLSISRIPLGI